MYRPSLTLLFVVISATSAVPAIANPDTQTRISELERQLANSEQHRNELARQLESGRTKRDSAQMALLEENQQLKRQVQQTQNPLTEQQTWYLIGAASALLGVLLGSLLRGRRKKRREWLN